MARGCKEKTFYQIRKIEQWRLAKALEEEELNENNDEPDDNDEILDETRQQENQIRAETPVRPLGSQFLDTFRT